MKIHGVLLVDKPSGPTSHDVVHKVRQLMQTKEVGHAGTLDPLASGLLVILLGEATKTSDVLLNSEKAYDVVVQLGLTTDSLDITGEVTGRSAVETTREKISQVCRELTGEIELSVPMFSAVKRDGKKLLDRVLDGEVFEPPKRMMKFIEVTEQETSTPDEVALHIHCEKGAYIRSWAAEFGRRLGCGGVVKVLRRTHSYPFTLDKAVTLQSLEQHLQEGHSIESHSAFVPLEVSLPQITSYSVIGKDERLMRGGQIPNDLLRRMIVEQKKANIEQQAVNIGIYAGMSGRLLSLLEVRPNNEPRIRRVFNYQ